MDRILSYFVLWDAPNLGVRKKEGAPKEAPVNYVKLFWNVSLYLGVAFGVFGQLLLEGPEVDAWNRVSLFAVGRSFVVAAVILPAIYSGANLDRRKPNFITFFICVQHGYFWPSILASLGASLSVT